MQRHRLESFLAKNLRRRRRRRTEQWLNASLLAGSDQLAQCRGFASARQTAQAGDAVTGAQDMVNRPLLILAQPVGRPVAGIQRCDRITSRIDRLNQIQFRCQNLPRGKSVFGFHQVRRILHHLFQTGQVNFALPVRQRRRQQLMLRHDGPTLEDMSDGVIQGLVFYQGDSG